MTATTKLDLELLQNGAANQTLSNETFHQLNQLVQAGVVERATTPPGSPANEALYLIIATATGAWAGKENQLAYWLTSTAAWQYVTPREGMFVHVNDEDVYYKYDGSAWAIFSSGGTFTGGTLTTALNEAPRATIASASTTDIGAADRNTVNVTGTTTITSFGTIADGAKRIVIFSGILTITHNATSLILPTAANITTAAGDSAELVSLGSGNWKCTNYQRADGTALSGSGGASLPVVQALSSTRNLALADNNTFNVNSTTNNYTVTILPQSSVAWTADFETHFLPSNTGDIVITGGTGVSVNGVVAGSLTLSTQNGAASIKRIAPDSWWVGGVLTTDLVATSINGGQLGGLRNKAINGNPLVNQRAVSGSVVLAAGAYGHDRWKAGASGCTYTFATSNNVTTLTISAGSLQQVIEGTNLQSGTHTLSWSGTAQGKIGAGSYSASGVTGSITGGTNTTIEFNTGTLSLVQLEFGSVASLFEHRFYGVELALCQRYFQRISRTAFTPYSIMQAISTTQSNGFIAINVMRTTPTVTAGSAASAYIVTNAANSGIATTALVLTGVGTEGFVVQTTVASGLVAGDATQFLSGATATFIDASAEL